MAENVRRDAAWAALRGIGVAAGITLVGMLALAALVVWAGLKDSALIALNQALKVVSIAAGRRRGACLHRAGLRPRGAHRHGARHAEDAGHGDGHGAGAGRAVRGSRGEYAGEEGGEELID